MFYKMAMAPEERSPYYALGIVNEMSFFFHHGSPSFLWGNPNMYARMFFVKVQHPFETKSRDNARPYFYSFYPFFPISAQCVCVILCVRACVCRIICYQVFFHHTQQDKK
jgi:hypothetical protein